ncbi:MAG: flagellar hook-basal body complex protein FliE [Nevskiales bacterium]|nr:flagellar hook-basal body complex protein FliE [Nevskiales bacterium]
MSSMEINQVLAQIRSLQAQAARQQAPAPQPAEGAPESGFASMLKGAIDQVNQTQQSAGALQTAFASGDRSVELADVMLASAKAQVNFRGMVEVRNRLVSAYQDIMNMPV